jgi:hypothetical protein
MKVAYVTMGPDRSLEKLRQKIGKNTSYTRQLAEWSSQYDWMATARAWDDQQAAAALVHAANKYRADLEAHRKKASDAGQALYTVAGQLLKQVSAALSGPRKIKGEDGKVYTLHGIDLNANSFSVAAKAMQVALDLEAHALSIDKLLPALTNDDSE